MNNDVSPSADSPAPQHALRGEKRRVDGDKSPSGLTHTRSKRNRYISIACNECKRRKIKCNGLTPCQRCGNLSLECVYAPNCCPGSLKESDEFKHMQETVTALQEQVNSLWDQLNELRARQHAYPPHEPVYSHNVPADPLGRDMSRRLPPLISPKRQPQRQLPQFHGPTSSAYGFDVAKSSLQTMGITPNPVDDGALSRSQSRPPSPVRGRPVTQPDKDPIWLIDAAEAMRLMQVYEEEIHIMYPIIDLDKLKKHAELLFKFLRSALRNGIVHPNMPGHDALDDELTSILKMVLATTLVIEGSGQSELGQKLFKSAQLAVDLVLIGPLNLTVITLIVLTATYYFQKDEETQAWRFIGMAGRLCVEMGLHRKDSLLRTFTNEAEYKEAVKAFWVVYALDRRWSFGTGMPFALQDSDIDPTLQEPDGTYLYLKHITRHNKLATRIWQHASACDAGHMPKSDEIGFLDYQVQQWYDNLPDKLKLHHENLMRENEIADRGLRRLRFMMYLRKNQARISIYRPIMHSATSINQHRQHAEQLVSITKDQINVITGVNHTSDIYGRQQVCFNYFLIQALAAIFLAVAHAPALFCHTTKDEFYAAIDLIKNFSAKSHTSKRLWRTIRGLREMGDKIEMLNTNGAGVGDNDRQQPQDAHVDAAATMAGLAAGGHKVDKNNGGTNLMYNTARTPRADELAISPQDGQQMSNELSAWFELAGTYGSGTTDLHGFGSINNAGGGGGDGDGIGAAGEGSDLFATTYTGNYSELTRIVNNLF